MRVFAERNAKRASAVQNGKSVHIDLPDLELLDKARDAANGAKFAALFDRGDWQGEGYPSQSEGDAALCNELAFYTGSDPGRIDSLFRTSRLMRDKWNRNDYRESTIAKALAGC
jgi:putative DNA primase/helicase